MLKQYIKKYGIPAQGKEMEEDVLSRQKAVSSQQEPWGRTQSFIGAQRCSERPPRAPPKAPSPSSSSQHGPSPPNSWA